MLNASLTYFNLHDLSNISQPTGLNTFWNWACAIPLRISDALGPSLSGWVSKAFLLYALRTELIRTSTEIVNSWTLHTIIVRSEVAYSKDAIQRRHPSSFKESHSKSRALLRATDQPRSRSMTSRQAQSYLHSTIQYPTSVYCRSRISEFPRRLYFLHPVR